MEEGPEAGDGRPRWASWRYVLLILGFYLTFKGYHSLDGDQAHRLPLLLNSLDPRVFADDPFVRAFDEFNPHRGSIQLLGAFARIVGLPTTLAVFFALTFALTVRGVHRLAEVFWPGRNAGWVAVFFFLAAKAGNIGTNHLFEAMLLDRLMALALGWIATAAIIEDPRRGWWVSALALSGAAWVHPSLGLQLALVFSGAWFAWALLPQETGVRWPLTIRAIATMALAIAPGLVDNLAPFGDLSEGLAPETYRLLTAELQSPQHMLPHLWREPQWLAAGAYLVLASLALAGSRREAKEPPAACQAPRWRLSLLLLAVLVWLGASWFLVEVVEHLGATVFQPFRIATLGRGVCLVLASGHVVALWGRGGLIDRMRAASILAGCMSDWLFAVTAAIEVVMTLADHAGERIRTTAFVGLLLWAGLFLARHDTEGGHRTLAAAVGVGLVASLTSRVPIAWTSRRLRLAYAAAWTLPLAAIAVGTLPEGSSLAESKAVRELLARCRFAPRPINDVERLAVWCREHTPESGRFVGPPGPKGFRLWSHRSWAFSRAGSPYHARGLRDWYERFRQHVDFDGPPEALVQAYLDGRHRLESRYDAMTDDQLASLAARQGAEFVVARADRPDQGTGSTLERLHEQGEYAVYRVRPEALAHVQP
ncbi:DUF6798 domain-containing protein [Paludisphaera rhizosphaerae]|uniref:DUF6798 domain-containing protein n=1 Tax=Paludisphaera rhizosphaerae TaxID=2711216 RepID=UPI0013EDD27A|nr:DUF6798 domain-containing protein [Paludisphaera rhizosphaerae]